MLFFFNDTATTEIYTLSLHDALPILMCSGCRESRLYKVDRLYFNILLFCICSILLDELNHIIRNRFRIAAVNDHFGVVWNAVQDRKSTRLNSSHANISYAVFCLKKKK